MRPSADRWIRFSCLVFASAVSLACPPKPIVNDPNAHVPLQSRPEWKNWSQNLVHKPSRSGDFYYFAPTNLLELTTIVSQASSAGV
jgi:hypothetical protein